jgi:hypothetical protein
MTMRVAPPCRPRPHIPSGIEGEPCAALCSVAGEQRGNEGEWR